MDEINVTDRVTVTTSDARLSVLVTIGDVVVTVAGPALREISNQTEAQVRSAALRLATRALDVAQQEIAQEQQ